MNGREMVLLAKAVEACRARGLSFDILSKSGRFITEDARGNCTGYGGGGGSDEKALLALLRDLGVESPEDDVDRLLRVVRASRCDCVWTRYAMLGKRVRLRECERCAVLDDLERGS
jgi:hypothetical protein